MDNNVGARLRQIRDQLDLSQKEFSVKLGVKQNYLSRYETGQHDIPDKIKYQLLEMGINLNWLFNGKGSMFINEDETLLNDLSSDLKELFYLLKDYASPKLIDEFKKRLLEIKKLHEG